MRFVMLAIQENLRPAATRITTGNRIIENPGCPNCGRPMHLARTSPRSQGLSDLHVYRCGECGVSLSQAADDGAVG
jgi:hypothetical protein